MSDRVWAQHKEGRVNLKVNRTPRRHRQLYPNPSSGAGQGHKLAVFWLEVGGVRPAEAEYETLSNHVQVLAALTAIDVLLMQNRPVPKSRWESFTEGGIKLWEIKAPPRGKNISRLLAYRESDWNMFVAFAGAKKSQDLPSPWKRKARDRVRDALSEGGDL
jgi:hypothetical protein